MVPVPTVQELSHAEVLPVNLHQFMVSQTAVSTYARGVVRGKLSLVTYMIGTGNCGGCRKD